jgi:succinate dehydrogenase / fumarate reductase membrane anchor subunit
MAAPYASTRTGRFAWMLQRVSALLLIPLAFGHFFLQHFTADAVSTGLATSFRLHEPLWVAYYAVFVTLVLFHGVNGLIGVINDYAPKQLSRGLIAVVLWSLAAFFGALGMRNLLAPAHNLDSAKSWYAQYGFPDGESAGNPPNVLWKPRYEFGDDELRELNLLYHYLSHQTHLTVTERNEALAVFGDAGKDINKGGERFDAWCLKVIGERDQRLPDTEERGRHRIFSSSYEFARWAVAVRVSDAKARKARADRENRAELGQAADAVLARLGAAPAFDPTLH